MRWFVIIAIVLSLSVIYGMVIKAQGDITPPVLAELNIKPTHIDTGNASQATTITATFVDDLSGFHDAFIVFKPEVGTTQSVTAYFGQTWRPDIESGLLHGIYTDTITLPQYAAEGWWIIDGVAMVDMVGNSIYHCQHCESKLTQAMIDVRFYNGTEIPIATPTPNPTEEPIEEPTEEVTPEPTEEPIAEPTPEPSISKLFIPVVNQ